MRAAAVYTVQGGQIIRAEFYGDRAGRWRRGLAE
jgi:hypothetical protein